METVVALVSIDDLVAYVHRTLCQPAALAPEATPLFRTTLHRGDAPAGYLFHIEGPHLNRPTAIWAADEGRILFYDAAGVRNRAVRLAESPEIDDSLAAG